MIRHVEESKELTESAGLEADTRKYGIAGSIIRVFLVIILIAVLAYLFSTAGHNHHDGFHRNIVYATHSDVNLKLDLLEPFHAHDHNHAGNELVPVLVNIHGGGWSEGDKSEELAILQSFAEIGWVAIAVNYRLAPDAVFPDQLDDCRAALKWVIEHVEEYGGDPDRIVLWGTSAGGHLALLASGTLNLDFDEIPSGDNPVEFDYGDSVKCVMDMAGPTDLTMLDEWLPHIRRLINQMLGVSESLDGIEEPLPGAVEASPVTYVDAGDPPVFIVHGFADVIVPSAQSEALYGALVDAGVEVEFIQVEGLDHEGHWEQSEMDPEEIWERILGFIAKHIEVVTD